MQLNACPDGTANPCEVKRLETISKGDVARDRIIISTEMNDPRDNLDQLVASGVQIDGYMKNPVVGWKHGRGEIDTPIGRTEEIIIRSGFGIEAMWEWTPWEMSDDADKIHRLWDGRFIHAASIWFTILEARIKDGYEKQFWPPLVIMSSVMREWGLVYVPADSQAHRERDRELFRMVMPRHERRRLEQRGRRRLGLSPLEAVHRMNSDGTVAEEARSIHMIAPLDVTPLQLQLAELRGTTRMLLNLLK